MASLHEETTEVDVSAIDDATDKTVDDNNNSITNDDVAASTAGGVASEVDGSAVSPTVDASVGGGTMTSVDTRVDASTHVSTAAGTVKETALNEADVASTAWRPTAFVPYVHHTHDPRLLRGILDLTEADPPQAVKESESFKALEMRQAENNASLSCHDCLGMNQQSLLGGILPLGYGSGIVGPEKTLAGQGYGSFSALGGAMSSAVGAPALPHNIPSASHVGEEAVLYPCGRHLTIAHVADSASRRLLTTSDRVLGIVTSVVSTDGKYLAVSERYVDYNSISIYRVDSGAKVHTLDYRMIAKSLVTDLHFSSNNRYLVTVTAPPEHKLILWLLDEMRVVGVCEDLSATPISRIRFSGWHSSSLVSMCPSRLVLWSHADRDITPIDVLRHHEQQQAALAAQIRYDRYGGRKGEAPPKVRVVPALVSQVQLFGGDEGRIDSPRFVAAEWYEDKCFAALTEDGWFIAVEDDLRVKMCIRIGLPDRLGGASRDDSAAQGTDAEASRTPSYVSHRASTVLGGTPYSLSHAGAPMPDASVASALSVLRQMATPQRRVSDSTANAGTARGMAKGHGGAKGSHDGSGGPLHSHSRLAASFSALTWCSRGLLVTGPQGWITLMDRTYDDHIPFVQMANISVCPAAHAVLSLSVSPGETNAVLALSTNTLAYISLPSLDAAIDTARAAAEAAGGSTNVDAPSEAVTPLPTGRGRAHLPTPLPEPDAASALSTARGPPTHRTAHASAAPSAYQTPRLPRGGASDDPPVCRGVVISGEELVRPMRHTQFHQSTVTSVSLALQRPFLATSAADGTVLVYDYAARRQVCSHVFADAVVSCALHPMGTQIVVCETFTAGLYGVLDTGLVLLTVIGVRGAQFARFSANGGRIAFAVSGRVVLFNSATLEVSGMLVGHASAVKGVRWCDNDTRLTTCDASGAVLHWNAYTCKRAGFESSHRNIAASGVCAFSQENAYAIAGFTRHTRGAALEGEFTIVGSTPAAGGKGGGAASVVCLRPGLMYPRSSAARKFHTSVLAFAEVSKTLFVGTPAGRIFLYSWPLVPASRPYHILDAHEGEVLHLLLSHDEQYLFSVGADGICFVHAVQHMREGRYMAIPGFDYSLTDAVLLVGADVQQRNVGAEVGVLNELIKFKGEDIAAGERILKREHEARVGEAAKAAKKQISALKEALSRTRAECKTLVEQSHKGRHAADKRFQVTSEAIENQYGKLAELQQSRLATLQASKDHLLSTFEGANAAALRRWEDTRASLETARVEREKQLAAELQRLQREVRAQAEDAGAMLDQTIVDGERDLFKLRTEQAAVLQETLEAIQRVGHVQSFGEREAERLRREIGGHREELAAKAIIRTELENQTAQNALRNAAHRNSNKLRQDEINIAEKKLQQLRQQLGSLENLRFVLIHQFEQLQSEIEPKESQLRQLERAVGEREGLLGHVHRERNEIKEQLDATNARLETANGLYKETMRERHTKGYGVTAVVSELTKALDEFGGNGAKALAAFRAVLERNKHRLTSPEPLEGPGGASSASLKTPAELEAERIAGEELARQAHYLECRHKSYVRSIAEKTAIAGATRQLAREENEAYLRGIRELQEERRAQAEALKGLESQLRDARMALHAVIDAIEAKRRAEEEERTAAAAAGANATPARQSKASAHAHPPANANLRSTAASAPSTPQRSNALTNVLPTRQGGASASKAGTMGRTSLPPLRSGAAATATVSSIPSPSKKSALRGALRSTSNASKKGGPSANDNDTHSDEDTDGNGSPTKPSRIASKAKRTAKERTAQRSQLQSLIDQLDENTDTMRAQQEEVHRLRGFVKELLGKEEASVARQVGHQRTAALPLAIGGAPPSSASGLHDAASSLRLGAGAAPMLLRIVSDGRHREALSHRVGAGKRLVPLRPAGGGAEGDGSASASTSVAPSVSAPLSIAAARAAEDSAAGIANDEEIAVDDGGEGEEVDWGGQQARPMTPVSAPQ